MSRSLGAGQERYGGPGDEVTFTITVYNRGCPADNIEITDYAGRLHVQRGPNPGWSLIGGNAVTTLRYPRELPTGGLAQVGLHYGRHHPDGERRAGQRHATGERSRDQLGYGRQGLPVEDADSTPDDTPGNDAGGNVSNSPSDDVTSGDGTGAPGDTDPNTDEDDSDPEDVVINPFDLAFVRRLGLLVGAIWWPGDGSSTITVYNQGLIPADNIEITDYITERLHVQRWAEPARSLIASNAVNDAGSKAQASCRQAFSQSIYYGRHHPDG